jgi:FAD/FMN-containing dehydrogenase
MLSIPTLNAARCQYYLARVTLGGGTGYLTRSLGLALDNLLEADLILAERSFMTASENQNSDLFWAIRGGGGNFGIVTSFLFRAHPLDQVFGGPMLWDFEHAREALEWYRAV